MEHPAPLIVEEVLLPCQCILMWSNDETRVVLCSLHSREYMGWDGKDDEFIRCLTTEHFRQMKSFDNKELESLR